MRLSGAAVALACALALVGCGGGEGGATNDAGAAASSAAASGEASPDASGTAAAEPSPSASPTVEPTDYLPVPAGVVLSPQGSALALGGLATVAWQPVQDTVGVLDVAVTRVRRTTIQRSFSGWQIPPETSTATPYFVDAIVTNRGETDLAGSVLPLYAAGAAGSLVESTTFASTFRPCRPGVLPDTFAPAASVEVCLVYFMPEGTELSGVSFRPGQDFTAITWTGEITRVRGSGGA